MAAATASGKAPSSSQFPSLVLPGQPLAPASDYNAGVGTHIFHGRITSALVGQVLVSPPSSSTSTSTSTTTTTSKNPTTTPLSSSKSQTQPNLPSLSVVKPKLQHPNSTAAEEKADSTLLPEVGSEVLARVTRINQRQATVAIFVVGGRICGDEFQGVIRLQDVRATEVDKVKIFSSFRPGDIVRARVISLGDQSNYYLSTASNNLGVIMANSEAGDPMYPSSWNEMKSTRTGAVEQRKVAKPF